LQTAYRGRYVREAYLCKVIAASKLQAAGRRFLAQAALRKAVHSVVCIQRFWRIVALNQKTTIDESIDLNTKGIPDDADTPVRGNATASLERFESPELTQRSILTQVERRSNVEVNLLLEGNVACLESSGICTLRLARRTLDAQSKSNMVANVVKICQDFDAFSESIQEPAATNDVERDSLVAEALCTTMDEDRCVGDNIGETQKPSTFKEDFSNRCTHDLASEAQQLLWEARRARAKFKETRQLTPRLPMTPMARPATKTKKESPMFGNDMSDQELPSPIKAEEEEWDWAKCWK
jgi:hypothetical protein